MKLKSELTEDDENYFKLVLIPTINEAGKEITARLNKNDLRQKDEMLTKLYNYMTLVYEKVEHPNNLVIRLRNLIRRVHLHSGMMFMSHLLREN